MIKGLLYLFSVRVDFFWCDFCFNIRKCFSHQKHTFVKVIYEYVTRFSFRNFIEIALFRIEHQDFKKNILDKTEQRWIWHCILTIRPYQARPMNTHLHFLSLTHMLWNSPNLFSPHSRRLPNFNSLGVSLNIPPN